MFKDFFNKPNIKRVTVSKTGFRELIKHCLLLTKEDLISFEEVTLFIVSINSSSTLRFAKAIVRELCF